jgi:hypothetical protein
MDLYWRHRSAMDKLPSLEFIGILYAEHPYLRPEEIDSIARHRMEMRHILFQTNTSRKLWRLAISTITMSWENIVRMLDALELERLRMQLKLRGKIGTINKARFDHK